MLAGVHRELEPRLLGGLRGQSAKRRGDELVDGGVHASEVRREAGDVALERRGCDARRLLHLQLLRQLAADASDLLTENLHLRSGLRELGEGGRELDLEGRKALLQRSYLRVLTENERRDARLGRPARLAANRLELGARLRHLDQVGLLLLQESPEFVGCELFLGAQVHGLMLLLEASESVERGVVLAFDALDLLFDEGERAPVLRAGVLRGSPRP